MIIIKCSCAQVAGRYGVLVAVRQLVRHRCVLQGGDCGAVGDGRQVLWLMLLVIHLWAFGCCSFACWALSMQLRGRVPHRVSALAMATCVAAIGRRLGSNPRRDRSGRGCCWCCPVRKGCPALTAATRPRT